MRASSSMDCSRPTVRNRPRRPILIATRGSIAAVIALGCHDATAPSNAGRTLDDVWLAPVSSVGSRTAVCHAAGRSDNPHFVELLVGGGALAAHVDAQGTSRAGHEGDYLVTARTPCPPPPTAPNVRLCKVVDANMPPARTFAFAVNGEAASLAGGACLERTVRVGTPVSISETVTAGTVLDAISVSPANAGSANIAAGTAAIVAGIDVAQVTFTNRALVGQLTLCKRMELGGIIPGYHFWFFITAPSRPGVYYAINAGTQAPYGNCTSAGSFPVGTVVGVWEDVAPIPATFGIRTTSITVDPADRAVPGTLDLTTRRVSVTIGDGSTRVAYVNDRPIGTLRICKNSPPGVTGTTTFSLVDPPWVDGNILVHVPANGCTIVPRGFGPGELGVPVDANVSIVELIPAGVRVAAISVDPSSRQVGTPDLSQGHVRVRTATGTTTVTYQNVSATP